MDWSFVFQILVDVWYVLFVYMIVVIVIGLCCNPDYDDRKHKIRCFVDETLNFFGLVFLCLTFVAVTGVCLTDATLTPSVPVFKKQVISDEKAGTKVPVKQDKIADGSGRKAVVEADGSDVSGGSSGAGTKVPVKQDKIADGSSGKAVVEADGSD
ncbi:MAG: hypothetical protein HFH68_02030, partial [Lachnospiraceae bacterium]|nr:hypothetical protein [Lachnospiraceae bacterium]